MDHLLDLNDDPLPLLVRLLIALGIGFLIGLEREYAKRVVDKEAQFAGVRTYTFFALFGFLSAFLSERHGDWLIIMGLVGMIALVITTYASTVKTGSFGITTELSAILTFLLGAVVYEGHVLFSVIITVITTSLLSIKLPLHRFIITLTTEEIRAFIQFVIISALVLPFLPTEPFGPDGVWDLGNIWTMVILVTGISLAGYLLSKVLGTQKGTLLAGIVGGLVSSTAVTLAMARRSREHSAAGHVVAAVGIIAASATLYPRILFETWVVDRTLAVQLLLPVAFITLVALVAAVLVHRYNGKTTAETVPLTNPLNFGVALQFGLLYMVVLWLLSIAFDRFESQGLYAASLVFGLVDMDAITLTIARRGLEPGSLQGVTAILLATLSNTLMKFAIVLFLGNRSLVRYATIGFSAIFLATLLCLAVIRLL